MKLINLKNLFTKLGLSSLIGVTAYSIYSLSINLDNSPENISESISKESVTNDYSSVGVPSLNRNPSSNSKSVTYSKNSKGGLLTTKENGDIKASPNKPNFKRTKNEYKNTTSDSPQVSELYGEAPLSLVKATSEHGAKGNTESTDSTSSKTPVPFDGINNAKNENDTSIVITKDGTTGGEEAVKPIIRGSIPPLNSWLTVYDFNPLIKSAYAGTISLSCTTPSIQLFDLTTMSPLADNPIEIEELTSGINFQFDPLTLGLDLTAPTSYFLRTSGCNYTFERIVTNFYTKQDLSQATTVVSQITKTALKGDILNFESNEIERLVAQIEETLPEDQDFDTTYNDLNTMNSSTNDFSDIFSEPPSILMDSLPDISSLTIPKTIVELAGHNFQVSASHWSSSYNIAYEWSFLDLTKPSTETLNSTSATWNFIPSANHPNNFRIILRIGKNDGSGNVVKNDSKIPYHEFNWEYPSSAIGSNFIDNIPVEAPVITLSGGQPLVSNSQTVNLDIDTGVSGINCQSFSYFTITESSTPPSLASISTPCSTSPVQSEVFNVSTGDGLKRIYIWTVDTNSQISTSKYVDYTLDTSAPIITFPIINDGLANTSKTFNWKMSEAYSLASNNFTLELYNGTSWDLISSSIPSLSGNLVDQDFSYSFTLPDREQVGAKVRLTVSDTFGNTATQESPIFNINRANINIDQTSLTLASLPSDQIGPSSTLTISNTGSGVGLNCGTVQLIGANASEFQITANTCDNNNLLASSTCSIDVRAVPTTKGAKSATLSWSCDTQTVTNSLSYTADNVPPVSPIAQSHGAIDNTPLNFTLSQGSDHDDSQASLTYKLISPPSVGNLTGCITTSAYSNDRTCTYTAPVNYTGPVTMTYLTYDGTDDSLNTTTVTFNVVDQTPTIPTIIAQNFTPGVSSPNWQPCSAAIGALTFDPSLTNQQGSRDLYIFGKDPSGNISSHTTINLNYDSLAPVINIATIPIINWGDNYTLSWNVTDATVSSSLNHLIEISFDGGSTWSTQAAPNIGINGPLTTAPFSYIYTVPSGANYSDVLFKVSLSDDHGQLGSAISNSFILNNLPPVAATNHTQTLRDNQTTVVNLSQATDPDDTPAQLSYKITQMPAIGTLSNCISNSGYGTDLVCDYIAPMNFAGTVEIKYIAHDGYLDSVSETTLTITVQDQTPTVPVIAEHNFSTATPTAVNPITFTPLNCTDIDFILIKEDTSAPTSGDARWQPCNAVAGSLSYDLSTTNTQGSRTLRIFGKDTQSNISTYSTISLEYDSLAPTINIATVPTINWGDTHTLAWTLTDATISSSNNQDIDISFDGGSTWANVTDIPVGSDGPHTNRPYTYDYVVPAGVNYNNVFFRITVSDNNGLTTAQLSNSFVLNNLPPVAATNHTQTLRDNQLTVVNLSQGSDPDDTLGQLSYKITQMPAVGTLSNCITNSGYGTDLVCDYIAPINFDGTVEIKYIVHDGYLDSPLETTLTLTVEDQTATTPTIAEHNFSTATPTAVNPVTFTPLNCNDIDFVLIKEDTISPTSGDSNWQPCSVALGSLSYDLFATNVQGTRTLRVFGKDAQSNISTYSTFNLEYDSLAPAINIAAVPTINWGDTYTLSWTLSDATISSANNQDVDISFDGGSSWTNVVDIPVGADGPHSNRPYSYNYLVPAGVNYNNVYFRITVSDNNGLTTAKLSNSFILNNIAPVVASNTTIHIDDNSSLNFTLQAASDVDDLTSALTYKFKTLPAVGTISSCLNTSTYTTDLSCTITTPVNANGTYNFSYVAYDGYLESSTETVTVIISDKTPTIPNLSPSNFTAGLSTNSNPLTLTAASCDDISQILIQESTTTPLGTDPNWQNCSTALSAITYDPSISNTQGFRTLRIFGKDPVGNISTYDSIDFVYDSNAPQLTFNNIVTLSYGIEYDVRWKLTEATISGTKDQTLSVSYNGGSTWNQVALIPVASNGPHTDKIYSYTYTVPSGTLYNDVRFRVQVTDDNGMLGTGISNSFRIIDDITKPFIHAGTFKINNSITPPATSVKYVNVDFTAEDADTVITAFCLKGNDTTQPLPDDECWRAFDAPSPGLELAQLLSVDDFNFLLGFAPANFKISIWIKDIADNISTNANTTAGKDFVIMNYSPDEAPTLTSLFVTNSDSPSNPVADSDLTFNNGDDVFIKWRATDNNPIPPGTVRLSYTTDDENFTFIPGATNLDNGINNCSTINSPTNPVDDNATGCFKWNFSLPSGQYFKINIVVGDSANQDTSTTSVALNSTKFNIIAGNTDPGTGSSAKSALLFPKSTVRPFSLAVSTDGKIFVLDATRGLMYINPYTNVLEQLLPETGASTGDGGAITGATANSIVKINIDYQDRLIIWDHDRIRRIDTTKNPMTIESIIGAHNNGTVGTNRSDTVLEPRDFDLYSPSSVQIFQPLPNGDIWFSDSSGTVSGSNNLIRIYKGSAATPRIESIRVSGTGASTPPYGASVPSGPNSQIVDIANENIYGYQITFDPETSTVTSLHARYYRRLNGCSYYMRERIDPNTYQTMGQTVPAMYGGSTCVDAYERTTNDGRHWGWTYHASHHTNISPYNVGTNTWDPKVLGNGIHGTCADGTNATDCEMRLHDFFVASDGTMFLFESNMIRVIDSNNKIQTLYGQSKSYGDGGLGQDARFGSIHYIDHGVDDKVILVDSGERVIREVRPSEPSAQMLRLAGNGTLTRGSFSYSNDPTTQMLDSGSWSQTFSLATDPTTGDVFYACTWHTVCKLNRSTGYWERIMGTDGGTHWNSSATSDALLMDMGGYAASVNAYANGKILTGHYDWSGKTSRNTIMRLTDVSTSVSEFVVGKPNEENWASSCPSGVGTGCNMGSARQNWNAITYDTTTSKFWFEFEPDRGSNRFRLLSPNSATHGIYYPEEFYSIVKVGDYIYACNENGELRKWNHTNGNIETLPLPGSAKCHGYRILYKPAYGGKPNRVVFPFNQNGLHGVAEYFVN